MGLPWKESSVQTGGLDERTLFLVVSVLFRKNRESVYEDRPEERLREEGIISLFPSNMAVVYTTDSH